MNSLGRPKEAFKSFSESLAIFERIGDNAGQAVSQLEIGKLLRGAEHFKVALDFFQRALNTHQWVGNPVKVAIDFESMDFVFETQGHYQEALIKYQEALHLKLQYSGPQDIAHTEQNLARVKRQM